MVEFQADVLEQVGLAYMLQAYAALLLPFGVMASGLTLKHKPSVTPDTAVLESSETMNKKPEGEAPADSGGR